LLRPIWVEKRETANCVRGRIETIIAKNVDVDDTDFRNPAELTKQLREKLPRRPKRVVRHHPALPYAEAPQFMADLSAAGGTAASMLRFLILTACRTNEVVDARWSEIDRASSTWKIPGERMKMHQDHVVPLSDPALAILDKMHNGTQGELIFPNPDDGMFSENAMRSPAIIPPDRILKREGSSNCRITICRRLKGGAVDEGDGAEIEIETTFRRKLAGLRRLSRRERLQALLAAREWRSFALSALREKRLIDRHARYMQRRHSADRPDERVFDDYMQFSSFGIAYERQPSFDRNYGNPAARDRHPRGHQAIMVTVLAAGRSE